MKPSRPPVILVVLAAIAIAAFTLPLVGLLGRAPWTGLPGILSSTIVRDALTLSILSSVAATMLALVFGVPLAWVLARAAIPGRSMIRAIATLPLVLPPVVAGAALLFALGRRGLIGQPLADATGIVLPFSFWGVVVANTFVAMPFVVITVEGALRTLDPRFEAAAATLGARPWTVFRRVTVPLVGPAIGAGALLTWARAFGEFGATLTFAGSLPGRTQTMPLAVAVALESDREAAIALSLVMVAVSLGVLVTLRDRWWRS